jgi:hypothetical protein
LEETWGSRTRKTWDAVWAEKLYDLPSIVTGEEQTVYVAATDELEVRRAQGIQQWAEIAAWIKRTWGKTVLTVIEKDYLRANFHILSVAGHRREMNQAREQARQAMCPGHYILSTRCELTQ